MRMTLINLFKDSVNGHIFRGKQRLVKPVSKRAMENLQLEYQREERIMQLLKYPYLSLEESSGHAKVFQKRDKKISMWTDRRTLSKMKPHVTIEERLSHLKIKECWD